MVDGLLTQGDPLPHLLVVAHLAEQEDDVGTVLVQHALAVVEVVEDWRCDGVDVEVVEVVVVEVVVVEDWRSDGVEEEVVVEDELLRFEATAADVEEEGQAE